MNSEAIKNEEEQKLTIGITHYNDYGGAAFTIQSLLLYHDLRNVEIVVIDDSPDSPDGKALQDFCMLRPDTQNVRYIATRGSDGAAVAKNRLFVESYSDAVLCIDCHVLLDPGVIPRLAEYFESNPQCQDILSGPMWHDSLESFSSHLFPMWRNTMFGVWANDPRAEDVSGDPFEIWAQGCGLFACRRDAWLFFNEHFLGVGGEEGYIQEKYRRFGRRALCLPWLRWWHRFNPPSGIANNRNTWHKVRNYIIGHKELDLPIDEIHSHFVGQGLMSEDEWKAIVRDPISYRRFGDT